MDNFDDISLLDALKRHAKEDCVPFHMPGHKRNGKFAHLAGIEDIDITELNGFDNLHEARGILKRANDAAARVFGTYASRMLVGGSTAGILAAVRALSKRGEGICVARNCHIGVYNAAELCELKPRYVMPDWLEQGFYGSVSPSAVEDVLAQNDDTKLVVVTSPTYEGVISDIAGIASVCRKFGAKLIVDEAHGAHLGFASFEKSARSLGADIVTQSLHKTLPSLTQTAILHICSKDISPSLVDEQSAVFQTSSPSYPLMASIEGCVNYLQEGKQIAEWANAVAKLREELGGLKKFELYDGKGAFNYDMTKLVFLSRCGMSGPELERVLRQNYKIELEMAGANYAIAMCGAGDTPQMYSRLKAALFELDNSKDFQKTILNKAHFENTLPKNGKNENTFEDISSGRGQKTRGFHTLRNVGGSVLDSSGALVKPRLPGRALYAFEAREAPWELVPIEDAEGRVAAENIKAYPPGCPIVAKGEVIDAHSLATLVRMSELGLDISGTRGLFPQNIAVLA